MKMAMMLILTGLWSSKDWLAWSLQVGLCMSLSSITWVVRVVRVRVRVVRTISWQGKEATSILFFICSGMCSRDGPRERCFGNSEIFFNFFVKESSQRFQHLAEEGRTGVVACRCAPKDLMIILMAVMMITRRWSVGWMAPCLKEHLATIQGFMEICPFTLYSSKWQSCNVWHFWRLLWGNWREKN